MEVIKTNIATVYIDRIGDTSLSRRCRERNALHALLAFALPHATMHHHASGAPYVNIDGVYISVSHSQNYAALAVASTPIGIDIEEPRLAQLQRVVSRFMTKDDYEICPDLLRAWTAKESVFKAAAVDGAMLADIEFVNNNNLLTAKLLDKYFVVEHIQFPNFLLALSVRNEPQKHSL